MMGSNDKPQNQLFYSFNLEDVVPEDHLLRHIDRFLDLGELRQHLAPYYSHTGRPSIDPELMIRMLIDGLLLRHSLGAAAVRGGAFEPGVSLVLSARASTDAVPDHSTFSKNRHGRFRESEAFRHVFERVLRRCMERGSGRWRRLCDRCQCGEGRCQAGRTSTRMTYDWKGRRSERAVRVRVSGSG